MRSTLSRKLGSFLVSIVPLPVDIGALFMAAGHEIMVKTCTKIVQRDRPDRPCRDAATPICPVLYRHAKHYRSWILNVDKAAFSTLIFNPCRHNSAIEIDEKAR
jgi:hypothetical protein